MLMRPQGLRPGHVLRIARFESFVTLTIRVSNNAGIWEAEPPSFRDFY